MRTPDDFRKWLLEQIDQLTEWSQPEPDLNVCQDAADIVREAGEIVLRFGLPDLYRECQVRTEFLGVPSAKELLGRCLQACNALPSSATAVIVSNAGDEQPGIGPAKVTEKQASGTSLHERNESPKTDLKLIHARAYSQYRDAEMELGSITDKRAYKWVKENSETDDTPLPPFSTWVRYVREGRKYFNTQKNSPRAGRSGRSIVSQKDIEEARHDSD